MTVAPCETAAGVTYDRVRKLSDLANAIGQRWKQKRPDAHLRDVIGLNKDGDIVLKGDFTVSDLQAMAEALPNDERISFVYGVRWEMYSVRRCAGKKKIGLVKEGHGHDARLDMTTRAVLFLERGAVFQFVEEPRLVGTFRVNGVPINCVPMEKRKHMYAGS